MAREHVPSSPTWNCQDCGREWPCPPARERLLAESPTGTWLRMYMWLQMEQAAPELRHLTPVAMFERFLKWAWPDSEQDPVIGS